MSSPSQLAALLACFVGKNAAPKARKPLERRLGANGGRVFDTTVLRVDENHKAPLYDPRRVLAGALTATLTWGLFGLLTGGVALRTPCIVRWPGRVPSGRASDEIMHVTDWFTTILSAAGVDAPGDRVIDGLDQLDWLSGDSETSSREGYIYWMGPQMYGVKWHNFKLVLVVQMHMQDTAAKLPTPRLINLAIDPQEREAVALPHLHTWVATHFNRLIAEFEASVKREAPIPTGAPLDHVPAS